MRRNVLSEDGAVERLNKMMAQGLARHLAFAVLFEEMADADAWEEQARNERARKLAKTARTKWPEIDVSWDLSAENYHRSLDGVKAAEFARDFPEVEVVGVDIEDLHANLMRGSQRVKDPFSKEYKTKTAGLVSHLERGGIVTPPFVRHVAGGLCLAGGNHRFGWARHRGECKLPILILSAEKPVIATKLTTLSCWP
jgi:uncharacterized protein YoaH (UPF0181 family)